MIRKIMVLGMGFVLAIGATVHAAEDSKCQKDFQSLIKALRSTKKSFQASGEAYSSALNYAEDFVMASYATLNQYRSQKVYISSSFIDSHAEAAREIAQFRVGNDETMAASLDHLEMETDLLAELVGRCVE